MRTVQETLRMLDRKELIDAFAERQGTMFLALKWKGSGQMTYSKLKKAYRRSIGSLLDDLLSITPKKPEDGKVGIIFGFPDVVRDELRHELILEDELREKHENTMGYGYSLTDWDEVMGYLVGDNKFSQENIYELMAEVMYEITWYGFDWNEMKEFRENMYRSLDEILDGRDTDETDETEDATDPRMTRQSIEEQLNELEGLIEKVRADKRNSKELFGAAKSLYHDYRRGRELERVLSSLPSSKMRANRGK